MTIYVVTTGKDIVDAKDGVMSLREAVAAAQAHGGADTITFNLSGSPSGEQVFLEASLKIGAGNHLTIDGATSSLYGNVTLDGGFKGNPFINDGFTMIEVVSGANVTLVDMTFTNGFERGAPGASGVDGTNGLNGNGGSTKDGATGLPGSNGNGGTGGTSATSDGKMAVAGIQNAGNLTLDRIDFGAMNAFGGAGGIGGNGGDGGHGGKGAPNSDGVGGNGGAAGHAGDAGRGSDGGTAVGTIYNSGSLRLIDTTIASATAYGANGGRGGEGGHGGAGGKGGASSEGHGGYGGYGGNGGNSGSTGDSGDAAGAILNVGTIIAQGAVAKFVASESAGISVGVAGVNGGGGGQGGFGDPRGDNGIGGSRGHDGGVGTNGKAADTATHVLGSAGSTVFVENTFVVETVVDDVNEGSGFQFAVKRLGSAANTASVAWNLTGVTASDLKAGQATGGSVSFAVGETMKVFTVVTAADGAIEGPETLGITLKNASVGTKLGYHKSETVVINDENHAPTALTLSKMTVDDDATVGTVVGTLSGADPDGDTLTFSLVSNPGGFFGISKNQLVTTKALDHDQHSYSLFVQANDGNGGSFSRSMTIRLDGYVDGTNAAERLDGSTGDDHIFGYDGADRLYGLAGADYLNGGKGADKMYGAAGNDTYIVRDASDTIIEDAGQGTLDHVRAAVSFTLLPGYDIERLSTALSSGTGGINLTGNGISQTITGNNGANRIDGKGAADVLQGLGGKDVFVFSTAPAGNVDRIVDFSLADDTIEMENAVYTALTKTGVLATTAFKNLTIGNADPDDRILYDQDTGDLFYDRDGSGTAYSALLFAHLDNKVALTAADFVVA